MATRRERGTGPAYQWEGRGAGAGYLSNPFDEEGRQAIARQFLSAPLGGHVRRNLQGVELLGHKVTGGQARLAEQGAAGLLATGIGVPAFLAAVDALNGSEQTAGTIPLS